MLNKLTWIAGILLLGSSAFAQETNDTDETKVLPGIAIVGNSETPKSLTIVPWRSAQISKETKLSPSPLNEELSPIDKDSFMREVEFYKMSNPE